MTSAKTCIGVVFGGASGEHNVSIQSAKTVINGLLQGSNKEKFTINRIYIDQKGQWWGSEVAISALAKGNALIEDELPNHLPNNGLISFPEDILDIDIWFPVLHGPNGEDGTIQGFFKLTNKPFVGSGVLGSAIAMDKVAMKAAFSAEGLPQVKYISANDYEASNNSLLQNLIKTIETSIGYPCFIKPANLGSSVGITKADNQKTLISGLQTASSLDRRIVIEEAINARELECGILGNSPIKTSVVGEIRFNSDWYDFETKYQGKSSEMLIPAPIPKKISSKIKELTLQACKAIDVNGIARVDFFYKEDEDEILINEINTLPGFTSQSMYPSLWKVSGIDLETLVETLVKTAKN